MNDTRFLCVCFSFCIGVYCILRWCVWGLQQKQDKDRREGESRHCCLGDVLYNVQYLNATLNRTVFLGDHPFCQGDGLVQCEPDDHPFFKAFIPPSSLYSIHPFLKIILVENSKCVKELNLFRPSKQQRRPLPSLLSVSLFNGLWSQSGEWFSNYQWFPPPLINGFPRGNILQP